MDMDKQDRGLQEKMVLYRVLEDKLNDILTKQNAIAARVLEIQGTLESLSDIGKSHSDCGKNEILFPIGCSIYMKGTVTGEKNVIVGLGAGATALKTFDEAEKMLEKQKSDLQQSMSALQKEMSDIANKMQKIEADAQEMFSNQGKPTS
jgi:prefoldin alpha subunit